MAPSPLGRNTAFLLHWIASTFGIGVRSSWDLDSLIWIDVEASSKVKPGEDMGQLGIRAVILQKPEEYV